MERSKAKPSKLIFTAKRFRGFLKVFLRNRRASSGLVIIFGFVIVAIAAPLLTPFDSLGSDPSFQGYVAGKYAAPSWLRHMPTWLGGDPTLSENMDIIEGWAEGTVNFTESQPNFTDVYFVDAVEYPYRVPGMRIVDKNGSLAVTFQRGNGSLLGETTVRLFTDFDYPYLGIPSIVLGNVEFLVNGSRTTKWYPREQWFIIRVDNPSTEAKNGSVSIVTSNVRGLFVAASTSITNYFGSSPIPSKSPAHQWKSLGYNDWKEWLNGTTWENGTMKLRHHWDDMIWVVSEGSLTEKTYEEIRNSTYPSMYDDTGNDNVTYYSFMNDMKMCDPDLNFTGNSPDIYPVNWTKISTPLRIDCFADDKTIYVESVAGFEIGDSILIGSVGFEEVNVIEKINATENSFTLATSITTSHVAGEPVTREKQKLVLYDDLILPPKSIVWVLVKLVLTDVDNIYSLEVDSNFSTGVFRETLSYPFGDWYEHGIPKGFWNVARKTEFLDVPVRVKVLLGTVDQPFENMSLLYPIWGRVPKGFTSNETTRDVIIYEPLSGEASDGYWILCRYGKENYISLIQYEVPLKIRDLFTLTPGRYRFCVEITFLDEAIGNINKTVSTTVYVDDFALKLLGTSFGLLGTDQYGRDLFSQLVYGTRISLYIGLLVAVLSVAIGLAFGLVAGYFGGIIDEFLMRFNDLLLVLPGLPLLIVLVAVLGARIENLILLLGLLGWNGFARVVRSQVLSLKERPFVEAAKAAGAGRGHIILRHILPNVMALVYVSLASSVPGAITAEAALSWLGFYDPFRMSWGRMLHEVFIAGATRNWWWIIPPGLCIAAIATAFILLGYALDEILNPKLRMRR